MDNTELAKANRVMSELDLAAGKLRIAKKELGDTYEAEVAAEAISLINYIRARHGLKIEKLKAQKSTHRLNLKPQGQLARQYGRMFEVRQHDRDFQVGHRVVFEHVYNNGSPMGTTSGPFNIDYVLTRSDCPSGIRVGYCVLGLSKAE